MKENKMDHSHVAAAWFDIHTIKVFFTSGISVKTKQSCKITLPWQDFNAEYAHDFVLSLINMTKDLIYFYLFERNSV